MALGLGLLSIICLAWTPFALLLNPLLSEARGKRMGRQAIRIGFRLYVRLLSLLCGCRFDLRELDELSRRGEPLVVVANHPSLLDAVILVSCLPNAVCIMKAGLMRRYALDQNDAFLTLRIMTNLFEDQPEALAAFDDLGDDQLQAQSIREKL